MLRLLEGAAQSLHYILLNVHLGDNLKLVVEERGLLYYVLLDVRLGDSLKLVVGILTLVVSISVVILEVSERVLELDWNKIPYR